MAHDFTSVGTAVTPSGSDLLTELDAINLMLSVIGETPVASVDLTLPDVAVAKKIFDAANRDVQTIGLNSNSDDRVHFATTNGELIIPIYPYPVLRIDASAPNRNVVRRGLKLWDKDNMTYQFPAVLCVDIVWFLPFADLPVATRVYITMKASKQFQSRVIGSEILGPYTKDDEYVAYNLFQDEELNTGDYTMLNSPGLCNLRNRVYSGWYGGCRLIDVSGTYPAGYGGDAGVGTVVIVAQNSFDDPTAVPLTWTMASVIGATGIEVYGKETGGAEYTLLGTIAADQLSYSANIAALDPSSPTFTFQVKYLGPNVLSNEFVSENLVPGPPQQ